MPPSSTPRRRVERGDNAPSSSSSPTLEQENARLRAELQRVLSENKGLRAECKGLRAAQSELQQRLVSLDSWPKIIEIEEEYNSVTRGYDPIEIICALKNEFQVPYTDDDAKALLRKKGFNPDDVREAVHQPRSQGSWCAMRYYSAKGDLMMCRWLYANGAAEDVSRVSEEDGITPMLCACEGGHLSVCEWLFEVGADGDISRADNDGHTPMLGACDNGHLSVCKWLFQVGADGDISRADNNAFNPMHLACIVGHLPVCKWLFEVGADEDISRVDEEQGITPMYWACSYGHLSVCKWLFEMGADGDISRANNDGRTPMLHACIVGNMSICEWLVLKGALNDPDSAGQHISQAIVERDIIPSRRPHLLAWAQGVVTANKTFCSTVLMGTFSSSSSSSSSSFDATTTTNPLPLSKLSGLPDALELVADFLGGVRRGRELRNARELRLALCRVGPARHGRSRASMPSLDGIDTRP